MKKCLLPPAQSRCSSSGLLLVRVVAGLAFMFHGFGKIQTPFNWMGPDSPVPGFLQLLAALSEFGGGLLWIVGLVTPLASFFLACTMTVATCLHLFVLKDPFVASKGGGSYELALVYLSVAVLLMTAGPGKFSADAKVFGER